MKRGKSGGSFTVQRVLRLPDSWPPTLTVVIDTEEEFDWSAPFDANATATENIAEQPLAQAIFDDRGLVPTYVIDYPVARSSVARDILGTFAINGRCEIGAHLHPWVNPPAVEPVDRFHSYPGNLEPAVERAKLEALTRCIEEGFGHRPVVYKAGRYGIGPATARILADLRYEIDASVVPHSDFSAEDGPDFSGLPDQPFVTAEGVLALPLSVHFVGRLARLGPRVHPYLFARRLKGLHVPGVAARLGLIERLVLTPEGHRLDDMMRQTRAALARGERWFMLTYHSSSLLPGAAPYVRTSGDRRQFLDSIARYLAFFLSACGGQTASLSDVAGAIGHKDGAVSEGKWA